MPLLMKPSTPYTFILYLLELQLSGNYGFGLHDSSEHHAVHRCSLDYLENGLLVKTRNADYLLNTQLPHSSSEEITPVSIKQDAFINKTT